MTASHAKVVCCDLFGCECFNVIWSRGSHFGSRYPFLGALWAAVFLRWLKGYWLSPGMT
jgi:hypothetical protein